MARITKYSDDGDTQRNYSYQLVHISNRVPSIPLPMSMVLLLVIFNVKINSM